MTIPNEGMIVVNMIVIVLAVVNLIAGIRRGFLLQLVDTIGLIAALFAAWLFSPVLAGWVMLIPSSLNPLEGTLLAPFFQVMMNQLIWFIVLFLVCRLVLFLFKPLVKALGHLPLVRQVNQLLGALFGLVNTMIWMVILAVILLLPVFDNGQQIVDHTLLALPGKAAAVLNQRLAELPLDQQQMDQLTEGWNQLTDEDRQWIRDWLSEHSITPEQIEKLLDEMRGEE